MPTPSADEPADPSFDVQDSQHDNDPADDEHANEEEEEEEEDDACVECHEQTSPETRISCHGEDCNVLST